MLMLNYSGEAESVVKNWQTLVTREEVEGHQGRGKNQLNLSFDNSGVKFLYDHGNIKTLQSILEVFDTDSQKSYEYSG